MVSGKHKSVFPQLCPYLCVDAAQDIVLLVRKLEQLRLGVASTAVLGAVGREQQEAISLVAWMQNEDETRYVLKKQIALHTEIVHNSIILCG